MTVCLPSSTCLHASHRLLQTPPSLSLQLLPLWLGHLTPPFLPCSLSSSSPTHSSDSRSLVSLSLSLKQPRECMLSRTSGSISSAAASVLMATFLGTGCSGSGSFFPALQHNINTLDVGYRGDCKVPGGNIVICDTGLQK